MFYKINGRAGYGKTHALIQDIKDIYDDKLGYSGQPFILITPTNKAAIVLNSRLEKAGLPPFAKTLHSTLYYWRSTGEIKSVKKMRRIDPNTGKFEVDKKGNPVYKEEIIYHYVKELKTNLHNKSVYVDESSMVSCDVWFDLLTSNMFKHIFAFGDERQLPPIEDYDTLEEAHKQYYRYWHRFNDTGKMMTLTENHRHAGDLKDMVETIESNLFNQYRRPDIPSNLEYGYNFSVDSTALAPEDFLTLMVESDIIITPYNKIRQLVNVLMRRYRAKQQERQFSVLPTVGDKIIFVDSIKRDRIDNGNHIKEIYLAKNVTATIFAIHDICLKDCIAVMDFIDEMGTFHIKEPVSLRLMLDSKKKDNLPRIDYAYAITVHSSQGGSWPNVLFLNSYWNMNEAAQLRYVGITRAQERLVVINGVSNKFEDGDNVLVKLGKQLGCSLE